MAATLAPRIEIYTMLACNVHKPEYTANLHLGSTGFPFPTKIAGEYGVIPTVLYNISAPLITGKISSGGGQNPNTCASDPVVQAAVAKLTIGKLDFANSPHI
jgi:hypothetical protein